MLGLELQPPGTDSANRGIFARLFSKIKLVANRKRLLKTSRAEFLETLDISALPKPKKELVR